MNKNIEKLKEKASSLPMLPGVYIMKNSENEIIYIGKAKKLKNRVSSYFRNSKEHTSKVKKLVEKIKDFDYIICDSEYEALVLECSLIKQNKPKYNVLLKDDRGYSYLKITNGEWPTLKVVFKKDDKNATYLGPYYSHYVIKNTFNEAVKIFKIPDCNKVFPRDYKKSRPCLNFYIGKCLAPCAGKVKNEEYKKAIDNAISFIKGGKASAIKELSLLMQKASDNLNFEEAAKYRDQIEILKQSIEKQKVIKSSIKEVDIIGSSYFENNVCFAVLVFKNYSLTDLKQYIFKDVDNTKELRTEFLKQLYVLNPPPSKIFIDKDIRDKELLLKMFSEKSGKKVQILKPSKGDNEKLLKMASLNAAEHLAKISGTEAFETAALNELAKLLSLPTVPKVIEAYDISHTKGTNNVGAMVTFHNGKPYKKGYRRFQIKNASGGDDYASLKEVLARRFSEYEDAKDDDSFKILPDLILIDGGIGQLNSVMPIIKKYNIPAFGMVKDSKHKTRAVADFGGEISIKANRRAYTLVTKIQDEVHRFAISYHRKLSTKKGIKSELINIEGVGVKRAAALLKAFKTIENIKSSDINELKKIVPLKTAEKIYKYYN